MSRSIMERYLVRLYLSSFRIGTRPDELLKLLGGRMRTALILNADDYKSAEDRVTSLQREMDELRNLGLEPREIDLRDYFGKPGALRQALSICHLVYVRGGNTFVLRRAFRQSGADELRELLARDAIVYGGYSAGVCVLAPSLRGLELVDDPNVVPDSYHEPVIWEGLAVLPYQILPHYFSDHPESEAMDTVLQRWLHEHVLFRALSDGEAIVVDGEKQMVVG